MTTENTRELLEQARARIAELESELERERLLHAACGVISSANTEEAIRRVTPGPEFQSASIRACIAAAKREIELIGRVSALEQALEAQAGTINALRSKLNTGEITGGVSTW